MEEKEIREELIKVMKKALKNYKKRLASYKEQQIKKFGFHRSLFADLEEETTKVEDLLSALNKELKGKLHRRALTNRELQLLKSALDKYQEDLHLMETSLKKEFPNVTLKKTIETKEAIGDIRKVFKI
jgi:uncharacterized membrane-anchored protein YhcB (DUF1043 family)